MAIDWNIYEWEVFVNEVSIGRCDDTGRMPLLNEYLEKNNLKRQELDPGAVRFHLSYKEAK